MTYISCTMNKNGIVVGSDTRANYFNDYIENGEIKGKIIEFYWDGNKKIFLLKKKFIVAAQGLLFWGDKRLIISEHIKKIEKSLRKQETVQSLAKKIHSYFRETRRDVENISETMHFVVCGVEEKIPRGFYVNTFYDDKNGVRELPFDNSRTLYVNGDGKSKWLNEIFSTKKAVAFCKNEILEKHKKIPFDVGNKLDILVMPTTSVPYWDSKVGKYINHKSYDELMRAIKNKGVVLERLDKPVILRYENLQNQPTTNPKKQPE